MEFDKDKVNICILGCGQIGSRHLQGLAKLDFPINIEVIDSNSQSLLLAKERYDSVVNNFDFHSINFVELINENKNDKIDLLIVATSSDIRKTVLIEILSKRIIKNIILEKIAFQSIQDFEFIQKILKKQNIACWINCCHRLFPSYLNLKKKLYKNEKLSMIVEGGNWGLACNILHYLDLFCFLTNSNISQLSNNLIENKIYESKRKGFIEFNGIIKATSTNLDIFTAIEDKSNNKPLVITYKSKSYEIKVFESENKSIIQSKSENWIKKIQKFEIVNQSNLTTEIAKSIIYKKTCNLPKIEESFLLHKLLLDLFIKKIYEITKNKVTHCQIT